MRFYFLSLVFICLFCSPLRAQQQVIDSLQVELKHEENNQLKTKLLINIGQHYLRTQVYFDSAFFYTEKARDLAKEENLEEAEVHALFNLGAINLSSINLL